MTEREAEELLDDAELVPVATGGMGQIKEMVAMCLEAEIPAAIGRPPGSGKS